MSDMSATVTKTEGGLQVAGYEKISYDFHYCDGVFDVENPKLAKCYSSWGRVLVVLDQNMKNLYGRQVQAYFDHYELPVEFHAMPVGEKAKNIESLLGICDSMTRFGIIRKVRCLESVHLCLLMQFVGARTCSGWRLGHGRCWVIEPHAQPR